MKAPSLRPALSDRACRRKWGNGKTAEEKTVI